MTTEIRKVSTRKELKRFVEFPIELYRDCPWFCPQLIFDEMNTLRKDKNPSFEYCEAEYWMAYRDGKPVGRIAGIINHRANQKWSESLVRFGWIDFIDDEEVSRSLIDTVIKWGRSKGMTGIHGPLGFTDIDPEGMLMEGFEEMSGLAMIYNYPYYVDHMVNMGFGRGTDWVQFEIEVSKEIPEKVVRAANLVMQKYGLRLLKGKRARQLRPWAMKMFRMLNVSFTGLYGFAPLTEKQMESYTDQYISVIRPEFVSLVVDSNDDVVAFGISTPNLSQALRKAKGHLFPFGFIHLLRALRKNDLIHMFLVGVRPDYQGRGVLGLVYYDLHSEYIRHGMKKAITHPQLEENLKAVSIWKNFQTRTHIKRRCWVFHFA